MRTRERADAPTSAVLSRTRDLRAKALSIGASLAGPAVIVGSVLIVLRAFAFNGMLTTQHPDVLAAFLPWWCFLGRTLSAGHIPAWNPYSMSGAPFAFQRRWRRPSSEETRCTP